MRTLLLLILLLATFSTPAHAQDDTCQFDFADVDAALDQARTATDTSAALDAIGQAKNALELMAAQCANLSPDTAGDKRSNPVPLGYAHSVEFTGFGKFTLTVTGIITGDEAEELIGSPADEGNKYVLVEAEIHCETDVDSKCELSAPLFSLVGSQGTVYTAGYAFNADTGVQLFGGGSKTFYLPFEVAEEDSSFVLFNNVFNEVYFALE